MYRTLESKPTYSVPTLLCPTSLLQVKALVSLFGGQPSDGLDALRYKRYFEKLATKSSHIQPQNLPPSSAAARYHSLRVYLQVKQWQGEGAEMSLEDWGWKFSGDQMLPITTDLPPAPQSILQLIRCNCSLDCSTLRCTCCKNNMLCPLPVASANGRRAPILPTPLTMTVKIQKSEVNVYSKFREAKKVELTRKSFTTLKC